MADSAGAPSTESIKNFAYVVHLLEDLGSPAHARNDLHACPWQKLPGTPNSLNYGGSTYPLSYCDVFEKGNVTGLISRPVTVPPNDAPSFIDTTPFFTPAEFFTSLQAYTSANYFSNDTVFKTASPALLTEDDKYFYGSCIGAAQQYGHCVATKDFPSVRKIASKGPLYYASCKLVCINSFAGVDVTVAQEQFDELGPVIAQHVAAFVRFYSPVFTLKKQGDGTGKIVYSAIQKNGGFSNPAELCAGAASCSSSFVQGADVTLTAEPEPGSTFVGWSGSVACSGTASTITVSMTKDDSCIAMFTTGSGQHAQVGYGIVTDTITVTYSGGCDPSPPFNYTSTENITAKSLRRQLPLVKIGDQWQPATVTTTEPTEIAYPYPPPIFHITSSINSAGIVTTVETGGPFTYTGTFDKDVYQSVTVVETIDLKTGAYHRVQDENWMVVPIVPNQGCSAAVSEHGVTTDTGTLAISLACVASQSSSKAIAGK